jgi:NADH dehydrogenase FAD-containing subunit
MEKSIPRIVIVGGGFGGLAAVKALRRGTAKVVLIDRVNHHVFQPLLYQVATAVLAPSQIGAPIRGLLGGQKNAVVLQATVVGLDVAGRRVLAENVEGAAISVDYDYLVIATGVRHSYFAHPEFERFAPGLKSLSDAVAIRNRIFSALERAEAAESGERRRALLTFVLVGAGPTGVEMASAIALLVRSALRLDYRHANLSEARVLLVDMKTSVLGTFAPELSASAERRLRELGVEVRLGCAVDAIDADGVVLAGERIASVTVIWTAGVVASPAGAWLRVPTDNAGRVRIEGNLAVPAHPEIFVIGDTARCEQDGVPLPGVAQVAIQQGCYVGMLLGKRLTGQAEPKAFRYADRGSMAVIGKGFAIMQRGSIRVSGLVAWFAWAVVHIRFLAQSYLRVSVFLQWFWSYVTDGRGARLILASSACTPVVRAVDHHKRADIERSNSHAPVHSTDGIQQTDAREGTHT